MTVEERFEACRIALAEQDAADQKCQQAHLDLADLTKKSGTFALIVKSPRHLRIERYQPHQNPKHAQKPTEQITISAADAVVLARHILDIFAPDTSQPPR